MKLPLCSLLLTLVAVVTSAHAAPRDDSASEKLGWHLATKAYTFRSITLYETIEITQALGLKYFELNPTQKLSAENPVNTNDTLPPELRAALKAKFAAAGIKVMNYGVVKLTNDEAADRKIFDFAKDMGIQTIVSEPPPEAFDLLDKLTAEYRHQCRPFTITRKPSPYFDPETVLKAIQGHSARIGACADTGHWTRSGMNAVDCLKKLEGHIITSHFKDAIDAKTDAPFGKGKTDIKGMMAELKRQNFHGVLSLEYESGATGQQLIDELKECIVFFDREAATLAH